MPGTGEQASEINRLNSDTITIQYCPSNDQPGRQPTDSKNQRARSMAKSEGVQHRYGLCDLCSGIRPTLKNSTSPSIPTYHDRGVNPKRAITQADAMYVGQIARSEEQVPTNTTKMPAISRGEIKDQSTLVPKFLRPTVSPNDGKVDQWAQLLIADAARK